MASTPVERDGDSVRHDLLAAAFDGFGASAVVLDGEGVIVDTNASWRLFARLNDGDAGSTGVGVNYLAVCERAAAGGSLDAAHVVLALREVLNGTRRRVDFEYMCSSLTEDRWFLLQASGAGDGAGAVLFHVDVTARKLAALRLAALAEYDELTGLANRRSALEQIDERLEAARSTGRGVWLHVIVVEGVNEVNDRFGRHVGDELLRTVSNRARHDLGVDDRLHRLGGSTFVLIGSDLDRAGAARVADRLRSAMTEPFQIGALELPTVVSIGCAGSRPDSSVHSLLNDVEQAMRADQVRRSSVDPRPDARPDRAVMAFDMEDGPLTRAGRELSAHGRRLAVLTSAQRVIATLGFDAGQVAARIGAWALALSGADAVTIEGRDGGDLVCQAVTGTAGVEVGTRRGAQGSVAGDCLASRRSAVWEGAAGSTGPGADWGMRSSVVVPLVTTDGANSLGVLTVASARAAAFDEHDVRGLEVIAGIAGDLMTKAELLVVLERTEARYRTLVDHLPGTAVMVFDEHLCLLVVAGPGARLWRYAERNVAPGRFLCDIVSPAELAILEPFYRGALAERATLEYHSSEVGLDFHFAAVPIPNADGKLDQLLVTVTDVTQVRADEGALREAELRYRTAFEEGPVGMARTALDGRFDAVNQALCDLTGYTAEQLCTRDFMSISHPDDLEAGTRAMASMTEGLSDTYRTEKRLLHADGHDIWIALSTAIVRDAEDRPLYFLSHFLDLTDRKRFESQLQHLADHDPMTGLANRRGLEATLGRQLATVARHGQAGALLVLDLDHFKQINDTLGHHAGDELVVSLASVVRRHVAPTDVVGRLGGDEFAVMLPYATRDQAERTAAALLEAVRNEVTVLGGAHARRVTTSIGIAMFDDPNVTSAEILINADLAMYDAKEAGRDRFATHESAESQPTTRARLAWVDRITHALDHDRFTLFAQPIMHLPTRQVTRHELLLRMIDDSGQIISPATFLGVAERFGMINRIDRWVVDHAISALAEYADLRPSFEVNLSGVSMGDSELLAFIERRLAETPHVDPSQLTFEVTETAAVANLGAARAFADRLTTLGCSFSLDDFGAGFGSFYYLKYLPFDDLKIDGEFIAHCLSNPTDQLVIDAVVTLASGLGKHTIAEYVGDQDTLDFLAARGVDHAQGFHVGRPLPLEQAMREHASGRRRERDVGGVGTNQHR